MSQSAPVSVRHRLALISRQRWLAAVLIGIEAGAVAMLSRSLAVPIIAGVLTLVGLWTRWRVELTGQRLRDAIGLLGLVFAAKYMLLPDNPRYIRLFPSQPIALSVGEFALVLQALSFFARRKADRLSFLLPGLGVVTLACVAIVEVNDRQRATFQLACVAFAMVAALFCDASRRFVTVHPTRRFGRPLASTVSLLILGFCAWNLSAAMYRYERQMDLWVQRYLMSEFAPTTPGFSDTAHIGSVSLRKTQESASVALRVTSDSQPDYFRTRAFSEYRASEWSIEPVQRTISDSDIRPRSVTAARHAGGEFPVADFEGASVAYEVWPAKALAGTFAAPNETTWVQADCIDLTANQHNILRSRTAVSESPYTVHVNPDAASARPPDTPLSRPPDWALQNAELQELADSIFADSETTADRIAAVTRYFGQYEYSLEVTVPTDFGDDPVAWFLLEKPAAHCEFFASGSAVLLRMAGVPCRYVTGFVFTDQNRFSGEWVARNRDAHAWVEAWDDESQRWVTVESTPGSGLPQSEAESNWSQFLDYLSSRFQQLRARWRQEGVRLIGHLILSALLSPVGLGLFGTALVVAALVIQRRLRGSKRSAPRRVDRSLEPLHAVLRIVDQGVSRHCRSRQSGETITAFADELCRQSQPDEDDSLNQAAGWYRSYAALRYSTNRSDAAIERISRDGHDLAQKLRRK